MNPPQNDHIDELIDCLQKHELAIAALYETFAAGFPHDAQKWQGFAKEERLHAKWINTLHKYLKEGKISFEQTKFTIQSTRTAISYIEAQIAKVAKDKPGLKPSLAIAVNIETALLESTFFKVFNLEDPKADKIRAQLVDATKEHLQKLMEWKASLDQ